MALDELDIMSGAQFVEWLNGQISKRESCDFTRFSERGLSIAAGLSEIYVHRLRKDKNPNPTVLRQRLIAYALGAKIRSPEEDVIPHRRKVGLPDIPSSSLTKLAKSSSEAPKKEIMQ